MKRKTPVKPYVLFSVFRSNTFYIKFYSNSILVYSFDADTIRLRRCTKITIDGGMPQQLPIDVALVLDPMLATGGSANVALACLKRCGVGRMKFLGLIAAPEGVEALRREHPDVPIHVGVVDSHLNEKGYIVPGLGDAGDRQFGTFAGPSSEPGRGPDDETADIVRRLQRDRGG